MATKAKAKATSTIKTKKLRTAKVQEMRNGELTWVPVSVITFTHPRKAGKQVTITTTSEVTPAYAKDIGDHIKMIESPSKAQPIPVRKSV